MTFCGESADPSSVSPVSRCDTTTLDIELPRSKNPDESTLIGISCFHAGISVRHVVLAGMTGATGILNRRTTPVITPKTWRVVEEYAPGIAGVR